VLTETQTRLDYQVSEEHLAVGKGGDEVPENRNPTAYFEMDKERDA